MCALPLPDGWIQQHDPSYNHPFWVDTRARPPRAIWVHPYEDDQFLSEHPDLRAQKHLFSGFDLDAPPPYDAATVQHVSKRGEKSGSSLRRDLPDTISEAGSHAEHKRGVLERLKDKAIETKKEREEHRRARVEQAERAEEEARQARMRQLEEREAYMREHGGYAPYHPSHPSGPPTLGLVLGGIVGGLLLGDFFGGGL